MESAPARASAAPELVRDSSRGRLTAVVAADDAVDVDGVVDREDVESFAPPPLSPFLERCLLACCCLWASTAASGLEDCAKRITWRRAWSTISSLFSLYTARARNEPDADKEKDS